MDFKIDGKKVKPTIGYDLPKIKNYLDKLPDGEMLSMQSLSERLNLSVGHLRDKIIKKLSQNYVGVGHKFYCGSEKTVKAYKAQL